MCVGLALSTYLVDIMQVPKVLLIYLGRVCRDRECPYYGFLELKKTYKLSVWGFVIFCKINAPPLEETLPQPTPIRAPRWQGCASLCARGNPLTASFGWAHDLIAKHF